MPWDEDILIHESLKAGVPCSHIWKRIQKALRNWLAWNPSLTLKRITVQKSHAQYFCTRILRIAVRPRLFEVTDTAGFNINV